MRPANPPPDPDPPPPSARGSAIDAGVPVQIFAAERPRLVGLAYRILGTVGDAEDVVQEAWLRWSTADHPAIERPAAWLTTVVTRLALDRNKAVARRREQYVGPWLPEPVATGPGPEESALIAESLTVGFLVVLHTLSATERAVWLLSDVFGEPFSVVASAVGKNEAACRQAASRARRRLREHRRPTGTLDRATLERLLGALARSDVDELLDLLDTDVVLVSDGGPNRRAARRPVVGAQRVARFGVNVASRGEGVVLELTEMNGSAAAVLRTHTMPIVVTGEQREGRIVRLWLMLNPDKLGGLDRQPGTIR